MKQHFAIAALLVACVLPAFAQDAADPAPEKARIAAERSKAEAAFKTQQKTCYRQFAVTPCLEAAREKRRETLNDLRRQELSINDAERKRRGSERLRSIEERNSAQKQEDAALKRDKAIGDQQARDERAAHKSADRAAQAASAPGHEAARKTSQESREQSMATAKVRREQEAADNLRRHQDKVAEAEQQRKERDKRAAERKKPPASDLPTPR